MNGDESKPPGPATLWLRPPELTRRRMIFALAVAVVADLLQIVLLPLEWMFAQQIVDVIAMALTCTALGFHVLLLPTFVVELVPVADMLPTWTGCVVAVIALRKRLGKAPKPPRQISPDSPKLLRDEPPSAG